MKLHTVCDLCRSEYEVCIRCEHTTRIAICAYISALPHGTAYMWNPHGQLYLVTYSAQEPKSWFLKCDDWNKTTNGSNVQSNAIAPILVLCLRDLLLLVLVRFSWYVGGVRFTRGWKEDIPPAYMVALCPPPSPVHSILAQHIGSYGRRVHG